MVSKDQGIGGAILAVCVIVILGYLALIIFPAQVYGVIGKITENTGNNIRLDSVVILVSVAFVAVLAIGAWIGWTMATTPPPKPIEEITTEIEEKKEDAKVDEPAPVKSEEAATTEDKTKKKK